MSNFINNYTLSSYNMQQKGRYYAFNSYRNELGAIQKIFFLTKNEG